jgi:hypothetical protein
MTPALRRLWLVGGALLAVGLALPGGGAVVSVPALLVLALAAGAKGEGGMAPPFHRTAWPPTKSEPPPPTHLTDDAQQCLNACTSPRRRLDPAATTRGDPHHD